MTYSEKSIEKMSIIGMSLRTDNSEDGLKKIKEHWQNFTLNKTLEKIPDRKSDDIYAVYTDYAGDHSMPYSLILGAGVSTNKTVPDGMVLIKVPSQKYAIFPVIGAMPDALIQKWSEIHTIDLKRTYTTDFELYSKLPNSQQEYSISIHIAIL